VTSVAVDKIFGTTGASARKSQPQGQHHHMIEGLMAGFEDGFPWTLWCLKQCATAANIYITKAFFLI